jgi:hypothetical protein
MNYKVMKRPMFKLGGKAASQGTGITSGLDEKVNMAIGGGVIKGQDMGAREGFADSNFLGTGMSQADFGALNPQGLMDLQASMLSKNTGRTNDMKDIIKLQALSSLASNVLPNIESGGFTAVTDFLKDPMTTQTAVKGLTGLKQIELAKQKADRERLSNLIANQMQFKIGERGFELSKEQFEKNYDIKLEQLDINRAKALVKSATQLKLEAAQKSREIFEDAGSIDNMTDTQKAEYYDLRGLLGDLTPSKANQLAVNLIERQNEANAESGMGRVLKRGSKEYSEAIEILTKQLLTPVFAEGGRVDRAMGTPMMGEKPMNQGMGMAQTTKQDVAMETQGQGNNVYAMLRARLPQEVSDEVVKLIAYNKEAFADFASIKNQEDVSSFNDKYGVQLVIDVATV